MRSTRPVTRTRRLITRRRRGAARGGVSCECLRSIDYTPGRPARLTACSIQRAVADWAVSTATNAPPHRPTAALFAIPYVFLGDGVACQMTGPLILSELATALAQKRAIVQISCAEMQYTRYSYSGILSMFFFLSGQLTRKFLCNWLYVPSCDLLPKMLNINWRKLNTRLMKLIDEPLE